MTSISSATQSIPVPDRTFTQMDGLKLKNLSENDSLLALMGYTGGDVKDFWQKQIQHIREMSLGPSQEVMDQQIAIQDAQPIHSVFRANGKIVAFMGLEAGITSTGAMGHVNTDGSRDEVAQNIKERLTKLYGNIQMETYSADSGVTVGMAGDEMFGRGPKMPAPEAAFKDERETGLSTSRLKTTAESLALFQEARKWYGR